MKLFAVGLGGHQNFLIGDLSGRGPVRDKGQPKVIDDPVRHDRIGEQRNESLALA